MKKIIFICLSFLTLSLASQNETKNFDKDQDYDLFITAGSHLAVWHLITSTKISTYTIPFNFHIDKVFNHKYALGIGYSKDQFAYDPTKIIERGESEAIRQNFRIGYYRYMTNYEKTISIYMGLSTGLSMWTSGTSHQISYWPTTQFLFGTKIKFTDAFYADRIRCWCSLRHTNFFRN